MPSLKTILDILHLTFKYLPLVLRTSITHLIIRPRQFKKHSQTYISSSPSSSKTVLIIGGSFTGFHLTHLLAHSLPTGYRVILIEKNSHFNYTFNFPRFSVLGNGSEGKAFIPFDGHLESAPKGIYERIVGEVTEVRDGSVVLSSGEVVWFEFLVMATGAKQAPPAKLLSKTKREACEELRSLQSAIKRAQRIAIVGGGAVGVQLAGDIMSFYPEVKEVHLIHSRGQLLNSFGSGKLHEYVLEKLGRLGVKVVLGERPNLGSDKEGQRWEGRTLLFKNGREEEFDLVIPCTGQSANSHLLSSLLPSSISTTTSRILVHSTLQISSTPSHSNPKSSSYSKFFAIGDVAETNAPKMARAGMMQAEVCWENVLRTIEGEEKGEGYEVKLKEYKSVKGMEGILKLSLGKDENVTFVPEDSVAGGGYLFPGKASNDELEVDNAWKFFSANPEDALIAKDLNVKNVGVEV